VGIDAGAPVTLWRLRGGEPVVVRDNALIAGADMPDYLQNADWSTYGYDFVIAGSLEPTGTLLDGTMLMTMDAARDIARARAARPQPAGTAAIAGQTLVADPGDGISAVLVLASPDIEPGELATRLEWLAPGIQAVPAPAYVTATRQQLLAATRAAGAAASATFVLAAVMLAFAAFPRRLLRRLPRLQRMSAEASTRRQHG
jgi:hypothetical protein